MKTVVIFMLTVQMKVILQSEVNPEEQVDSAEVLTEPVSFSSVLYIYANSQETVEVEKGKSGTKKDF